MNYRCCHFVPHLRAISVLLDQYLPFVPNRTYSADKPWITSQFRELIKRRQRAFLSGQTDLYHKLHNQTKRLATSLRQSTLRSTSSRSTLSIHIAGGPRLNTFSILPIPTLSGVFRIPTQTSPLLSQSMTFCQHIGSLATA